MIHGKWLQSSVLLLVASALLITCAADPDLDNSPGTCKISCKKPKNAGNNMRIRFLMPQALTLDCQAKKTSEIVPIPVRFVVEKPRVSLPSDITSGSSTLGGTPAPSVDTTDSGTTNQWVPVSNISFQPVIFAGALKGTAVNSDGTFDPSYGVLNDPESWCTDSCGVGSVDVQPMCIPGSTNSVTMGIQSGNISKNFSVVITGTLSE